MGSGQLLLWRFDRGCAPEAVLRPVLSEEPRPVSGFHHLDANGARNPLAGGSALGDGMVLTTAYSVGSAALLVLLVLILLGSRPEGAGRSVVVACATTLTWTG